MKNQSSSDRTKPSYQTVAVAAVADYAADHLDSDDVHVGVLVVDAAVVVDVVEAAEEEGGRTTDLPSLQKADW